MDDQHADSTDVVAALRRRVAELERQNRDLAAQAGERPAAPIDRLALEEERSRIAMEIHDSVAQQLYGIVYTIDACLMLLPDHVALAREQLSQLLPTAQRATVALRRAIFDLWPEDLDAARFAAELRGYVEEIAPASDLEIYIQIEPGFDALPMGSRRQLYRIAQEALSNVLAHARARRAKVTLVRGADVRLRVADDGRGFDPQRPPERAAPARHLGLTSMRERAALLGGWLEIDSAPGQGTTLTAIVPVRA